MVYINGGKILEKLKEFIEKKKEKSSSRRPRYGTRKLSVGLVSCVLGYCIFMSPTVVNAQVAESETSESTQVSETREVSETSKASDIETAESSKVESPAKETEAANEVDKNLAPVSTNDDTKAPKTGDAGILSSAGLASLAASGLAYLELKKRNKKNK